MSRLGRLAALTSLILLQSTPRLLAQTLGIEEPLTQAGDELWGTLVPLALGVIAFAACVVAFITHHIGLFLALLMVLVLIFTVGFGIPTAIENAGLTWSWGG